MDPRIWIHTKTSWIRNTGRTSTYILHLSDVYCRPGGHGPKSKSPSKNWSKIIQLQENYDILPEWYVMVSVRDPWHFGADPYLWPTDPDNYFFIFFSYNLPAGTFSSVLKIKVFAKVFGKIFFLHALFQSYQHLYEKREVSGSEFVPLTYESRSGRHKNIGIRIQVPNTGYGNRSGMVPKNGSESRLLKF
jgi:hypothetical protein